MLNIYEALLKIGFLNNNFELKNQRYDLESARWRHSHRPPDGSHTQGREYDAETFISWSRANISHKNMQ